jgi:MSHA pilin protein MshD
MRQLTPQRSRHRAARGMTLIELVIAIAVISIAVSTVLALLSAQATRSAEAMIREQASAIASAYLSEIMQKNFAGPAVANRAMFNNVNNYVSGPAVVSDQRGNVVVELDQFRVAVAVNGSALNGISVASAKLVTVTVTHATGVTVRVSGYKTKYP